MINELLYYSDKLIDSYDFQPRDLVELLDDVEEVEDEKETGDPES